MIGNGALTQGGNMSSAMSRFNIFKNRNSWPRPRLLFWHPRMVRAATIAAGLQALACPAGETASGETDTATTAAMDNGSSGDAQTSTGATIEPAESSSSSSSGGPQESSGTSGVLDCEAQNPEFGCAAIDCSDPDDAYECGAHHVFDDGGCMRAWCDDDDMSDACAADEICFRPGDCAPALPCELANCWTDEGLCVCEPIEPCAPTYGWCIPADANPC